MQKTSQLAGKMPSRYAWARPEIDRNPYIFAYSFKYHPFRVISSKFGKFSKTSKTGARDRYLYNGLTDINLFMANLV